MSAPAPAKAMGVKAAEAAAVALALAMVAYRFFNADLVAFINDEPIFLEAARQQVATGHWVLASPIAGNQGMTYGPSVMWFYGVVQLVLGAAPAVCIAAMCLFVSVSQVAVALGLTRVFKGGAFFFATLLAFIASSPYQFFWSRLAWDPLVDVGSGLAVWLLATRGPMSLPRAAALGLVLGLAVSSHLMVLLLVVGVVAVLVVELARTPKRLLAVGAVMGASGVGVNLPYLVFLGRQGARTVYRSHDAVPFLERLLQVPRVATLWKVDYFFDDAWQDFLAYLHWPGDLSTVSAVLLAGLTLSALAGLAVALVKGDGPIRRVAGLAAGTWVAYPILYAARGLAAHPHYQFPTWWVIPVGLGGLLWFARPRLRGGAAAVAGLVWAVALAQLLFIAGWMSYIRARGGTQGIHYSTPLAAQRRVVREACSTPDDRLRLVNETALFPHSLSYVVATEPACAGKQVRVCGPDCPEVPGARSFHLGYAGPAGGSVQLR